VKTSPTAALGIAALTIATFLTPALTPAAPNIEDAAASWRQQADIFVMQLQDESFETTAYRTSDQSDFINMLGNLPIVRNESASVVELLCRTRRVRKSLQAIASAKQDGTLSKTTTSLSNVVGRLLEDRTNVYAGLRERAKEHPESFKPGAKEDRVVVELISGYAGAPSGPEDPLVPPSLMGTSLGISANVFLLGVTEHPDAVRPILRVADFDEQSLRKSVPFSYKPPGPRNAYAIADALDRILCSAADTNAVGPASGIAREYVTWRKAQGWNERPLMKVQPYDSPMNPKGIVTPAVQAGASLLEISLPLSFGNDKYEESEPPVAATIIEWGRTFEKARNAGEKGN
jgi:hypothetical protein